MLLPQWPRLMVPEARRVTVPPATSGAGLTHRPGVIDVVGDRELKAEGRSKIRCRAGVTQFGHAGIVVEPFSEAVMVEGSCHGLA